jgi:hypothetical protein
MTPAALIHAIVAIELQNSLQPLRQARSAAVAAVEAARVRAVW